VATSRIADSVGRVLGDRYRLTRPLGVGASAHVYVAEDVSLRRRVAIKVLHPGLAGDEAFGRRFRAEAQVVAALRHPNILRVYDWGEDEGRPFLVMELLEGGSLRALLDRGQLLSPAQAAAVGADVARALDYAHRRGLVHRDIKPANLIFDDEARITVADFGLARALAEATWTEPAGAVVGTARYAAPEQVRGESLDSRADVYALALVLIEATTGTVPFAADTTLATLMGRVDRPITIAADLGPLGAVLEAAGTVDPAGRLDAIGLARALDGVAARLPPPAPLPLAAPAESDDPERDNSPTDYPGRTRLFDGALVEEPPGDGGDRRSLADRSAGSPGPAGPAGPVGPAELAGARSAGPPPASGAERAAGAPAEAGRDRRPRRRRLRWLAGLAVLLVLIAGGTAAGLTETGAFTPTHPVPRLVGLSQANAQVVLRPLHLHLVVAGSAYDPRAPAGAILTQRPATGRLKEGAGVTVTVSRGPQPVPVPSVDNLTLNAATSVLDTLGLKPGHVSHAASLTVAAGLVISSHPAGGTLLPGQTVDLLVSTGKPTVAVPALSGPNGASFAAAQAALAAANLPAVEHDDYSDIVPPGQVTVTISKGPHLVAVPNVARDSVGAASQALASLGFQVSGVTGNPIYAVIGTSPPSGTSAHYGSAVQILTG
jgi:serine/threonine-protein kinase